MKKKLTLLPLLSALLISGCNLLNISSNSSASNNSSNQEKVETKLLISEYIEGSGENNKAIEIYNFSDEEVDLSEYKIAHYRRETTPDSTVALSGTIKAKETFVVVADSSDSQELRSKADLISKDLFFTGKGVVALLLNDEIVDSLGYLTYYNEYAADVTLVRKVDYLNPRVEYDAYDWIKYAKDNYKYLGNVENSVTPEELLNGPCLDDKYLDLNAYPFYYNTGNALKGGGGAVKGAVKSNIDGDTSDLYVEGINPSEFMESKYYGTTSKGTWLRARYYGVDTPESGGVGGIQEFGMMAKYYTAYIQNNAENMYIQTVKDDSLLGNFGRLLGYIWADKDTMVNYETIKAGYSVSLFDTHYDMMYKDIPYESYFYNANLYARKNKLGRYGEKDPYWNYDAKKSYCEFVSCGNYFENGGSILA